MKILIAEDDAVSRRVLEAALTRRGFEVAIACDGAQAWEMLQSNDAAPIAILDWMMPHLDGLQVCQQLRHEQASAATATYLILLTARSAKEDTVTALQAGFNDYIIKPFDAEELLARVEVGVRIIELQLALADRVRQLEDALARVHELQGLLPVCSYCKKIRDDQPYWQQVEHYATYHTDAGFGRSLCLTCHDKLVKPRLQNLQAACVMGDA
jgi:DNA-binding response OmpR family regulator